MFITQHFEGRLCYETNKVVCIDVYARCSLYADYSNIEKSEFITQVLLSLVNKKYHCNDSSKFFLSKHSLSGSVINERTFLEELDVGISNYLKVREKLELDCR